jgi:uncharacterized protein (DUF433 family)
MNRKSYIETNENVLAGKPVLKETRISVEHIISLYVAGWTENQILENYPSLNKESLQAVFAFIQELIRDVMIYENPVISV